MSWKQHGFFRRWHAAKITEASIEREQKAIEGEDDMLETTDLVETEVIDGVEVPVEKEELSINHAKLFLAAMGNFGDQTNEGLQHWFNHLRQLHNLETDDQLEDYIWKLVGKPDMEKNPSILSHDYMFTHYAKMALINHYCAWADKMAQRIVFECDAYNEWSVTVDRKAYPVRFGNPPKNHDIMPQPFYNFKNNKAIMHVITVDGVVSMLINRDYQIIKALDSDGNSIDKFTVDRSGNVLDLLMVTTTLGDIVNKDKE